MIELLCNDLNCFFGNKTVYITFDKSKIQIKRVSLLQNESLNSTLYAVLIKLTLFRLIPSRETFSPKISTSFPIDNS